MSTLGPPCPRCGRARRCYGRWKPQAGEVCGYCRLSEEMRGNQRAQGKGPPGVPVYDEQGAPFAPSVSAATRRLGCVPHNLHFHHLIDYRDGYQLKSRPNLARVGRRGGSVRSDQ